MDRWDKASGAVHLDSTFYKMYELFFANLDKHIKLENSEILQITGKLKSRKLKKNESLLEAGEVCKHIYFVNKGCLRLFHHTEGGEEHNILFCPENWWCADLSSFTSGQKSFYAVSSLEETEVLFLTHEALEGLYIAVPKLERFFRILYQNGFSLYQRRITKILSKPANERYRIFKKQYPGLEQRIAQKQIASYLGITPVFLSMIRGKNMIRGKKK